MVIITGLAVSRSTLIEKGKLTMVNMLGVKDVKGILVDLLTKLTGDDWGVWFREIKKFLRKEPCWVSGIIETEPAQHSFAPFLTDTFGIWYDKETAEKVEQKPLLIKPKDIDWETLKDDIDEAKFGEYSLNPETQGLDFESSPFEKIKVLDFKEFVGKPRAELAKNLALNYAHKYHIPGIEYWKYIIENPDKAPDLFKDFNYYYFPGSMLRHRDGRLSVPNTIWVGERFCWYAGRIVNAWRSDDRVVLVEK